MKASELIAQLQALRTEYGADLDIALVQKSDGGFYFDLFPEVDILQYPADPDAPPSEDEPMVTVIGITNHKCEPDDEPEPHLKLVRSDADDDGN